MRKGSFTLLVVLMFTCCWLAPAFGEVDQEQVDIKALQDRVRVLEKKLESAEKVTTKIEKEEAALKEEKKERALAYYKDGFFIETPDKRFRLQIGGVLHFDIREFESHKSANSLDIRRARIDLRGSHYAGAGDIEQVFRIQLEMADTAYLRNCYWMFKVRPEFALTIGQYKIPSGGADNLTEEAQVNFIEYATSPPVSTFFDRGVMITSKFLNAKVQTCLGAFTGQGTDVDLNQGDIDNQKDYALRLLLIPFKDMGNPFLKGLHLGGSYVHGLESIRTTRNEASMRTENYESRWYKWNQSTLDLDKRRYYGSELHYLLGPATFSYEFNRVEWGNMITYTSAGGAVRQRLPDNYRSDVHQVWVSYFLTGEEKQFEDVFFCWRQPKPKKNFSLKDKTWGAWEIIARYAFHNTSDELFKGPTGLTSDAVLQGSSMGHSITGGIRWIWNPKCRIMLDITQCKSKLGHGFMYTDETSTGGGSGTTRTMQKETAGMLRFILTP